MMPYFGSMTAPTLDPVRGFADAMLRRLAPAAPESPRPRRWQGPGGLAAALDPTTVETPALRLIDQELVRLFDDPETDRLIITMPPQEGKSVRTSIRFVEWAIEQDKNLRVAIVSYADEMARRHGADIKTDVETFNGEESPLDLGIELRADSRAAGRWHIKGYKGGVYCTGIGGSLTGKAVDILIIDDPYKNQEQAHSEEYRKKVKAFWRAVCIPRLGPGSKCVVIQTRWHEDDLAGWLPINEPGQWRIVNIPAQAESDDDALGRKPGEYMVSARGDRNWQRIKSAVGSYVWGALYQGRPSPAAGGLFKRKNLRYWAPMRPAVTRHGVLNGAQIDLSGRAVHLDDCWRFLTVDLAASKKTSADWTAVGVWAITPDGDLVMLDGARARIDEKQHWSVVLPLYQRWKADVVFVESRMFGTTMVYEAGRANIPVKELVADTDKVTRAIPASIRSENGRLWLPTETAYPDVGLWVNELVSFPNAAHDDCVDVIAYAARVQAAYWVGQRDTESFRNMSSTSPKSDDDISRAFAAALGDHNVTDLKTVRW